MDMIGSDTDVSASQPTRTLRVVVTGGSGHIGHVLCKALVQRGHDVTNLDKRLPSDPNAAGRFIYCDLRDRQILQPVLERHDAICHLGEIPGVGRSPPEEVFAANTAVGSTVLQTAADVGLASIIYTSSCQAYGYWEGRDLMPLHLPFDETMPLRPRNAYAASKAANEAFAQALCSLKPEACVAAFRFPWVMADDLNEENIGWFINVPRKRVDGFSSYVHVNDAVQAYLLALENPRQGFEAYHFVADRVRCSEPIRDVLARVHPTWPKLPADWPAFKSPVLTDKAKAKLGWRPTFDLLEYAEKLGKGPSQPPASIAKRMPSI